jgi:hypothetical protein
VYQKVSLRQAVIYAYVLASIATVLNGCGDHVDSLIIIRLRALVIYADQPVEQATVWLSDKRFRADAQPSSLRKPVCITDGTGKCAVVVRYSYGYVDWPWRRLFRHELALSERFELSAEKDGHLLAQQALSPLSPPQIQGVEEVFVRVRLGQKR